MASYGFSRDGAAAYARLAREMKDARETIDAASGRLGQATQELEGFDDQLLRQIQDCVETTRHTSASMTEDLVGICQRLDTLAQKILSALNLFAQQQQAQRQQDLTAFHEGRQNGTLSFHRFSFSAAEESERPRMVCIPARELMCDTDLNETAATESGFWGTAQQRDDGTYAIDGHRASVEAYEDLARKGDQICQLMKSGLTMTKINEQHPELADAVAIYNHAYGHAGEAVAVYQYGNTYIFSENGGRHRVLTAKRLGLDIPVLVTHTVSVRK